MPLAVVACLAVGLAIPTTAAASFISVTSVTSCGMINSPGVYELDADVTGQSGSCFDINASDVTLNLNGHTVTAQGGDGDLIDVLGPRVSIVGPGTITRPGCCAGIALLGGSGSVRGVTVTGRLDGIHVQSAGNSITGNVANGNGTGIAVLFEATGNRIIGNSAHGNVSGDLFDGNANCDSNIWRGNDFGTANRSCASSRCSGVRFCGLLIQPIVSGGFTQAFAIQTILGRPAPVGILVERRVHNRWVRVGKVPFGLKHKGHLKIKWRLRVGGHRLRKGRYRITFRMFDRKMHLIARAKPVVIRIR